MGEVDGHLHRPRVVMYNRLLKCMLKVVDKEADMMLFTSDAKAESICDEVVDVVIHEANVTRWCEVADDALSELCPLDHGCILCRVHVPWCASPIR